MTEKQELVHKLINKAAVLKALVCQLKKEKFDYDVMLYVQLMEKGMQDVEYSANRIMERTI